MKAYADNAYEDEITANASGIHVIADGMSGEYVVVGKILANDYVGHNQCPREQRR